MKKLIVILAAGFGLMITLPTAVNADIVIVGDYTELYSDGGAIVIAKCDPSEETCLTIKREIAIAPPQAQNGLNNRPFTVVIPAANRTIRCFGYECIADGDGKQEIRLRMTP